MCSRACLALCGHIKGIRDVLCVDIIGCVLRVRALSNAQFCDEGVGYSECLQGCLEEAFDT